MGRRANAADFGTGEGLEAISRSVGETGDLAMRLFDQEMDSRVVGALSNATRAMTDLAVQVESEPDHNKRLGMYQDGARKIGEQFRAGVQYPRYQQAFDERFFQQVESGRIEVLNNVRNARIASAQATLMMAVDTHIDSAQNHPDPIRRAQIYGEALMDVERAEQKGTVGPVRAAQMKLQIRKAQQTEKLIFDTYALADEIYDGHEKHEDRIEAAQDVPAHMRERVTRIVHNRYIREQAMEKEANDAQYIDLSKRAKSGEMSLEELDDEELRLRDTNMPLTPVQYEALQTMIEETDNKGKTLEALGLQAEIYDKLVRYAGDPVTRPDFLKQNVRALYGHVLDETLIKKLEADQAKGTSQLDKFAVDEMEIALAQMKLPIDNRDFKGRSEKDMRASLLFRERVQNALERARHEKQLPLTSAETRAVIQGLKDEISLSFWTSRRLFQMTPDDFLNPELDVPDDVEALIRNVNNWTGNDVATLIKIQEAYVKMLRAKQVGLGDRYPTEVERVEGMPEPGSGETLQQQSLLISGEQY